MQPVKVLCIGGSDSSGGAGIQADLKAVSACGGYGLSVVTAVTAQNTYGVQGIMEVTPEFVKFQMETVLSDIGTDAVKTGMLLTSGTVGAVAAMIGKYHIKNLVVDPVMLAKGGRPLMLAAARRMLVNKLLPLAQVVTPNIPEAEKLAGIAIRNVSDMKKAARLIQKLGARNVIIKGGHLIGCEERGVVDVLYDGHKYHEYYSERISTENTHGTGCTYASVLASYIARGWDITVAAGEAKKVVAAAIKNSVTLGGGYGSVNVLAGRLKAVKKVNSKAVNR